jgi:hypothetical protein
MLDVRARRCGGEDLQHSDGVEDRNHEKDDGQDHEADCDWS